MHLYNGDISVMFYKLGLFQKIYYFIWVSLAFLILWFKAFFLTRLSHHFYNCSTSHWRNSSPHPLLGSHHPQSQRCCPFLCCIQWERLAFRFICLISCHYCLSSLSFNIVTSCCHYLASSISSKLFNYQLEWFSPSWPCCLGEISKITFNEAMWSLPCSWHNLSL